MSAATYTAKKALETSVRPTITDVIPRRVPLKAGQAIVIVGAGFGQALSPPAAAAAPRGAGPETEGYPAVMLDGVALTWTPSRWQTNRIEATLSDAVAQDYPPASSEVDGQLVVVDPQGVSSDPFTVALVPPPP